MSSLVSMPSTSFYPFLLTVAGRNSAGKSCQCPQRASTYFYNLISRNKGNTWNVSMPSTGFYLFLHKQRKGKEYEKNSVNALNGLLLISTMMNTMKNYGALVVSMPSTGFYSFLQKGKRLWKKVQWGVNALNGLLLISTDRKGRKLW